MIMTSRSAGLNEARQTHKADMIMLIKMVFDVRDDRQACAADLYYVIVLIPPFLVDNVRDFDHRTAMLQSITTFSIPL